MNWYKKAKLTKKKKGRCWEGYEPVPGKEPYEDDSCKKANGGLVCRSCGKSMAAVKELCDDCEKKGKKSDNPEDNAYHANRAAIQARHE
jgi:hypothetical protein